MSPTVQSRRSDRATSRRGPGGNLWVPAVLLAVAFLVLAVVASVVVAQASEGEAFHRRARDLLARTFDAEVDLGKIDSASLLFLRIPEIRVIARDRKWGVILEGVTLELDGGILWRRRWTFRSAQVRQAEIWLGWSPPRPGPGSDVPATLEAPAPPDSPGSGSGWSDWLASMLCEGKADAILRSIRVGSLKVSGPVPVGGESVFELRAAGEGSFADGRLDWVLREGTFRGEGEKPWSLQQLQGTVTEGLWGLETGELRSADEATIRLRGVPSPRRGELGCEVALTDWKVNGARAKDEGGSLPFAELTLAVEGRLTAPFPDLDRYQLAGRIRAERLGLGQARAFGLLAGQTGVPELAALKADVVTGRVEWSRGAIRLFDLVYEEPGLARVEGRLSVVESEIAGVFEVLLPAYMVGRIPGGKPKGFSYPASGWSRAVVTVQGPAAGWSEDLTSRLLDQLPEAIGVEAGPELPITAWDAEAEARRAERVGALFEELIR